MRKKAKHVFIKREDKPPLSGDDVLYWQSILPKILKVGFEFEVNLPDTIGSCSGDSLICPCSNPKKETTECYKKCTVYDKCTLRLKHSCPGQYCIEFISPCPTCEDHVKNCKSCELFDDPDKSPPKIREQLHQVLMPTNDLSEVGKTGTYQVTTDGSLNGNDGAEIVTVGRRVSYQSFYGQANTIIKNCMERGAYLNERTSIHMHLIGGYFDLHSNNGDIKIVYKKGGGASFNKSVKDLEKPLPEIVLANFLQLIRRYHNAITWISSAGTRERHLTRWVKFRKPIIKYSPVRTTMRNVLAQIASGDGHKGKYSFVNFYHTRFAEECSDVERLHIEGRFCDGMFSPSAVASLGILLYALMIKAVVLSRHGLIQCGSKDYMQQSYDIQSTLLNNDGPYGGERLSDTSCFDPYKEVVRQQADEMVEMVKHTLRPYNPAYKILKKLADTPCSMRLIRGDTWEKIERDLDGTVDIVETRENSVILEAVDTVYIDECENSKEWITALSEESGLGAERLETAVEVLQENGALIWDQMVGTFLRG